MQRRFSCYKIFLRHGKATSKKEKKRKRVSCLVYIYYLFSETFAFLTFVYYCMAWCVLKLCVELVELCVLIWHLYCILIAVDEIE